MRILTARLVERELQARAQKMARLKGEHVSPEWGNQIRSYVLHPYKMVKDHRTDYDTSDADANPGWRHRRFHKRVPDLYSGAELILESEEIPGYW